MTKERWKLIKEFASNTKYYKKQDKIYISNYGRYKLNDAILTLGYGLVYSNNDIKPYKISKKTTYQLVYQLFNGDIPLGWTIHHIDHNHFNNNFNNLACIPAKQHASIHRHDKLYRRQIINAWMCKELRIVYKENASLYRRKTKSFLLKRISLGT